MSLSYRKCWHRVAYIILWKYVIHLISKKGFYNCYLPQRAYKKNSIALTSRLDLSFLSCQKFLTAATDADGPFFSSIVIFSPLWQDYGSLAWKLSYSSNNLIRNDIYFVWIFSFYKGFALQTRSIVAYAHPYATLPYRVRSTRMC